MLLPLFICYVRTFIYIFFFLCTEDLKSAEKTLKTGSTFKA